MRDRLDRGDSVDFAALAELCAPSVAVETIAAIVSVESAGNPLAIGVNGGKLSRQPQSKGEAIAWADDLMARGYSIDLGLGQINSGNLDRLGLTVTDALDSCTNLQAASYLLSDNYARAVMTKGEGDAALVAALSAYNTGDFERGVSNGYVAKVAAHAGAQVVVEPVTTKAPSVAEAPFLAVPAASAPAEVALSAGTEVASDAPPPAWDIYAQAAWAQDHTQGVSVLIQP